MRRVRDKMAIGVAGMMAVLALAGCVNQQKEVLRYREVLDGPNAKVPATQPSALPVQLSLRDAMLRADEQNDQLALAGEDYVQALIERARAAMTFLPSISFAPSFTWQEKFKYPTVPGGGGFNFASFYPQNYTDLPINTQIQTNLVRDTYAVSQAGKTADQRAALLLDLQSTVLLNVAQTYYGILEAEENVRTLSSSVQVQEARVRNVTHRAEQGLTRRLDVLQTEADTAGTRVRLTDARNNVVKGRATLTMLIGSEAVGSALVDDVAVPERIDDPAVLLATARANRQDLRAAAAAVASDAAGVKSAWGQYFPSVGLNLNTFLYRESFPTDSWWTTILTVNLPLFEEGIIHNNVREAYSHLRQSVTRAQQADRQVNEDVQTAYADFTASSARLKDLETEAESSRQAYESAEREFAAGTATNLDVLTAQNSKLNSELELESERLAQKVAYLTVLRVTGKLDRLAVEHLPQADAGGLPVGLSMREQ